MGNIRIDLANVITMCLVGFLGTWAINRALAKAGMSNWQA
jgi:hypothetical protein